MSDLPKLYSGAAKGADSAFMKYAEEYGFPQEHFVVSGSSSEYRTIKSYTELQEATPSVQIAAKRLNKTFPRKVFTWKLIHRNWFQICEADAVFAVAAVSPNLKNVQGGTGWAVAMAIESRKIPVYTYDQDHESWFRYSYEDEKFMKSDRPEIDPTWKSFAGIGTRELTEKGEEEIKTLLISRSGR